MRSFIFKYWVNSWVFSCYDWTFRNLFKDFFRHKRHDWVKEAQNLIKCVKKNRTSNNFFVFIVAVKYFFRQFNVPVSKFIPDEVVKNMTSYTEFELVEIFGDFGNGFIEIMKNPAISDVPSFSLYYQSNILASLVKGQTVIVHENIAGNVPNCVNEIPGSIHLFIRETHVLTRCRTVW